MLGKKPGISMLPDDQLNQTLKSPDLDAADSLLTQGPTTPAIENTLSSAELDVVPNYRLVQPLGSGGMGEVWLAEQLHPVRRHVAIKLIRADGNTREVLARFEAERQTMAMMDHPHVARILDAGTATDGRPYFAMEVVHGQSLTEFCDQQRLTIAERLELFIATCSGVQHAHQKGIIHRDLKPTNILVTLIDGRPVPKVIDFGLAKAIQGMSPLADDTAKTQIGQILGTLKYMSPEQAALEPMQIDTRSDIYALGVVLYELLTGSTPLDDSSLKTLSLLAILEAIRQREPIRPSVRLASSSREDCSRIADPRRTHRSTLSRILVGDLDWIVMKALDKDPELRYASVQGLIDDVEHYLRDEPVSARPPSIGYRLQKFMRKNRSSVVAAALILATLILGFAGTSWGLIVARQKQLELGESQTKERVQYRQSRLQDADRLRSRGQYLAAANIMRSLQVAGAKDVPLSSATPSPAPSETLTLASDLFQAQEVAEAQTVVSSLDRQQLTLKEQAELDLLQGDLWLMSADDADGFESIQKSISSGLLEEADLAYAQALVADNVGESNQHLNRCLQLNPMHASALTRRICNLIITGELKLASNDIQLGQQLFPDDLRLVFLQSLLGCLGNAETKAAAIDEFRKAGGKEIETRGLQLIAEIHSFAQAEYVATDTSGANLSAATNLQIVMAFTELMTIVSKKYDSEKRVGFPTSAWMGKLYSSCMDTLTPSISSLVTRTALSPEALSEVHRQLPQHQFVNFLVAQLLLAESKNVDAYPYLLTAARADEIIAGIRIRAAWWAIICAAIRTVQDHPVDLLDVRDMERILLSDQYVRQQPRPLPVPPELAYKGALRLHLIDLCIYLCQNQMALSQDDQSKTTWQQRLNEVQTLQLQLKKRVQTLIEKS